MTVAVAVALCLSVAMPATGIGKTVSWLESPVPLELFSLTLLWQISLAGLGEEFLTVRAPRRRRPRKEVQNGLPDGRHTRLWWWAADSFFSVPPP
jgi:hypothetical protein